MQKKLVKLCPTEIDGSSSIHLAGFRTRAQICFFLPANVPQQAVCTQTKRNSSLDSVFQETLGVGGKAEVPHYNLHISQNDSQAILGLSNRQRERGHHEGFVPKVPVLKKPEDNTGSTTQHREPH